LRDSQRVFEKHPHISVYFNGMALDEHIKSGEGRSGLRERDAGNRRAAVEHFERALLEKPGRDEAVALLKGIADSWHAVGNYDLALDALRRALAIDPQNAVLWNDVGLICRRLDRNGQAREAFERALACDPGNAAVLVNMGACALRTGDIGAAKESLDLALAVAPGNPQAHANLALTLALFGRIEEAEEELRLAVFYGFEGAGPIQDRIDRLKAVREQILARAGDTEAPNPAAEGGITKDPT